MPLPPLPFKVDHRSLIGMMALLLIGRSHASGSTVASSSDPCSEVVCEEVALQGGCSTWTLTVNTDGAGAQTTWTVVNATTLAVLASGGPYPNNYTITAPVCLPSGGCYILNVHDSGGNGMPGKGFVLRDPTGKRVIDNAGNGAGFTTDSQAPEPFCSPVGDDRIITSRCDHTAWFANEVIYASENQLVSAQWGIGDQTDDGYQFWFFDPNGGYSRKTFRSHATSEGMLPSDALRATKLPLASIVTNPLPQNRLLNVRVRARINGVNLPWGAACRFKIDEATAMCMPTALISVPGPTFSCGRTDLVLNGTDNLWATPVNRPTPGGGIQMANRYRFRFENPSEAYARNVVVNTYWLTLTQWATLPLQYSRTYDVYVQASYDSGNTWCPYGTKCQITIRANAPPGMRTDGCLDPIDGELSIWPNPNEGTQLHLQLPVASRGPEPVEIELLDLTGKMRAKERFLSEPERIDHTIELTDALNDGVYLVIVRAGSEQWTRRLVIEQ